MILYIKGFNILQLFISIERKNLIKEIEKCICVCNQFNYEVYEDWDLNKRFGDQSYDSDYDFVQSFVLYEKEVLFKLGWTFNITDNPNHLIYYI